MISLFVMIAIIVAIFFHFKNIKPASEAAARFAYSLCAIGTFMSVLILFVSYFRLSDPIESLSAVLMFWALVLLGIGIAIFALFKMPKPTVLAAILLIAILLLSLQPWYVEHSTPEDVGDVHRHSIWKLGHVH